MILLPNNKIIIMPPHTASRHVHTTLSTSDYGGKIILGQTIGGQVDHHYNKLPLEWADKDVYLFVRNPYDRLIGLYLHYTWAQKNIRKMDYLSWPNFVYWSENPNWIYRTSISAYMRLSNVKKYTICKYENLQSEINNITEKDVTLIPPYHDKHDVEAWYNDSNFTEYVNDFFAREDCEKFGYEQFN